jgi:hypothetical protein
MVLAGPTAGGATGGSTPSPRELLESVGQFTQEEWAAVERGQAVARLLDTDAREIAVVGAVRIAGSANTLLVRYRDLRHLKRGSVVLDVSRFSPTPQPSDLISLPLEEYSLDLRRCRHGDCQVRLGAADVERFQRDVNWQGSEWRAQSASVWREVLYSYTTGYLAHGRSALPAYVNKPEPLRVADELSQLVRAYQFVAAYSPEFHAYLQEFGPRAPAGADHALYWTKEDFGIRPVLRISHQVVYRTSTPALAAFVATNQIYADHYLDAALGLVMIMRADAEGDAFYMISVNRARTRSLSGVLRRLARAAVQNRSREAMRTILSNTKALIENGS